MSPPSYSVETAGRHCPREFPLQSPSGQRMARLSRRRPPGTVFEPVLSANALNESNFKFCGTCGAATATEQSAEDCDDALIRPPSTTLSTYYARRGRKFGGIIGIAWVVVGAISSSNSNWGNLLDVKQDAIAGATVLGFMLIGTGIAYALGKMYTLHMAARDGDRNAAGMLLAEGVEVNVTNKHGDTPLHWAALNGRRDMAEWLLTHGADVNAKANDGATPLHRAVLRSRNDVVEFLRQHGGHD